MISHFIATKKFAILARVNLKKLEIEKSSLVNLILESLDSKNFQEIERICRAYKSDRDSGFYYCYQACRIFSVNSELGYDLSLQKFSDSHFIEDWVKVIFDKLLWKIDATSERKIPDSVYFKDVAFDLRIANKNMGSLFKFFSLVTLSMVEFKNFLLSQ